MFMRIQRKQLKEILRGLRQDEKKKKSDSEADIKE